MKLVNMQQTKDQAEPMTMGAPAADSDAPRYPWGLSINLEDESLQKLGMAGAKMPDVNDTLTLQARVTVTRCSSDQTQDGGNRSSCTLQITDLGLEAGPTREADAAALYNGDKAEA